LILHSIKEGLPYTLLEAGSASLPCLSTYVGGIPEIIRNNYSGILVDPTIEKIRGGLEFLLTHTDKAKEFGKNLKHKVDHDFSLKRMITETIHIYTSDPTMQTPQPRKGKLIGK
jgi:glycosyltransferase involved in cell wall biosynthesis